MRKQLNLFFGLFILAFLFFQCSQPAVDVKQQLIGSWTNFSGVSVEYTSEGFLRIYTKERYVGPIGDFGHLTYRIDSCQNDSILVSILGEKRNSVFAKELLRIEGDRLTRMNYKMGEKINNHIDEYIVYTRGKVDKTEVFSQKDRKVVSKYIIPTDFTGKVLIAFNQNDGVPVEYDRENCTILRIPSTGLLQTMVIENPFELANGQIAFYAQDSLTKKVKKLKISDQNLLGVLGEKERSEILEMYDLEEVCVFVQGYNQNPRKIVNTAFGKEINGNVAFFVVDALKNLLE